MIIIARALLEEQKNEILAEITKFRVKNGIQEKIIVINIPETLENHNKSIIENSIQEEMILENIPEMLENHYKSIIENGIQEEMILENIPEMLENPGNLILPEHNISLEESRARKYHTKNMVRHFNRAQQYYRKHTYHNSRTKKR